MPIVNIFLFRVYRFNLNFDFVAMQLLQNMISKNPQKYKVKAEDNYKFVEFNRLFDSVQGNNVSRNMFDNIII